MTFPERFLFVFLRRKSDAFETFKKFEAIVKMQTDTKLKIIQTDGYMGKGFQFNFLNANGIQQQKTAPHTPEQNCVAEKMKRTLVEKTQCNMFDAN